MQSKKTVVQACGSEATIFGTQSLNEAPTVAHGGLGGFTYDSRKVVPGGAFVAVRGLWVDGHEYIDKALEAGVGLIIAETPPTPAQNARLGADTTWVQVPDSSIAMGQAADAFYGHPSRAMTTFAVTGTNGKTTVTSMLYQVLEHLGVSPGLIGTVEHRFAGVRRQTQFTTPPSADLHALLAEMRDAGCTHVALEASSHGLAQNRLAGATLSIGAFTNLTQDHLDYHETMKAYFLAKAELFKSFVTAAVFNVDDPMGRVLAELFPVVGYPMLTFSTALPADTEADAGAADTEPPTVIVTPDIGLNMVGHMQVVAMKCTLKGTQALVDTPWGRLALELPMIGAYNVANALTTLGMLVLAGFQPLDIVAALALSPGAAGRLEVVPGERHVFVDYAHTPDALLNVCSALKALTTGRLIVVFGAGGDRDPSKRPKMGAAVQRYADVAVVTSDNPRTEDPQSIVDAVLSGMKPGSLALIKLDRRDAIEAAIEMAHEPNDVVLIAGKGHEDYQINGTEKIHFDDREEAARALRSYSH